MWGAASSNLVGTALSNLYLLVNADFGFDKKMESDETEWLEELLGFCVETNGRKRNVDHGCAIAVQGMGFGFKMVFLLICFIHDDTSQLVSLRKLLLPWFCFSFQANLRNESDPQGLQRNRFHIEFWKQTCSQKVGPHWTSL